MCSSTLQAICARINPGVMNLKRLYRWTIYLVGLMILACGLILMTKTTLGTSPIISVAYAVSEIWQTNFGNATLIWYTIFVIIEILLNLIRRPANLKSLLISDILQIPLSIAFTRFMNMLGALIPVFEKDCAGTFAGTFAGRILLLVLAIILTGIGAAMSLDVRMIPNPGDGVVQAVADFTRKKTGTVKNFWDLGCVLLTIVLSLALAGKLIGIGIGTVLAVIGVGRVIALFNHFFLEKIKGLIPCPGSSAD